MCKAPRTMLAHSKHLINLYYCLDHEYPFVINVKYIL